MSTINSTAVGEQTAFRSWVDHPTSASLPARRIVIRGWVYHRGGSPILDVRARIGNRLFRGSHGDPRPDVKAMFGAIDPAPDNSGFDVPVILPARPAACHLECRLADGEWIGFQAFPLNPPSQPASRRLFWLRFWANAWCGRPQLWQALTRDERDFVVAQVRARGWLNLHLSPQYPPRRVAPEAFPQGGSGGRLPRLTVVTPSFQQGAFLEATLRSVLEQPCVRIDYIVQDGASTDGSVAIIERHASRLRHWESTADAGQADAIVRGFRHSDGEPEDLMMYLNSDDLLMPGAARYVAAYFAAHPEVDAIYGHRVLIDDDGAEVGRWYSPRQSCDDLRLQDLVPQETLIWRRRIWDKVGGIDPSFHFAMDWDLLLRFVAAGARIVRLPRFLGQFRLHTRQKSQAQMNERGIPEMNRLRERTLGRPPTEEEMHCSMRRAQFDSALVHALACRGIRV